MPVTERPTRSRLNRRRALDLNKLFASHQVALIEMLNDPCDDARRWAGERADYFADRIIDLRSGMGAPYHEFVPQARLA